MKSGEESPEAESHKFSIFSFTYACLESVDGGKSGVLPSTSTLNFSLRAVSLVMNLVVALKRVRNLINVFRGCWMLQIFPPAARALFSLLLSFSIYDNLKLEKLQQRDSREYSKVSCYAVRVCKEGDEERNKKKKLKTSPTRLQAKVTYP